MYLLNVTLLLLNILSTFTRTVVTLYDVYLLCLFGAFNENNKTGMIFSLLNDFSFIFIFLLNLLCKQKRVIILKY